MYSPEAMTKRAKRKMSESEDDDDDEIFDGIKRLYNDDHPDDHVTGVHTVHRGSCKAQARCDQGLPSLQAVEAT